MSSERKVMVVFKRYFVGIFGSNGVTKEEFRTITREDVASLSEAQRDMMDD